MTMPAPPGDPNDPGDRGCPGCPNCARPPAFGPPGAPGFPGVPGSPAAPGWPSKLGVMVGMLDRFRPLVEMVGDVLRDAADIFRPGPDEARFEAEALRSRHVIDAMEAVAKLYRDAAFYEASGAKTVAAKMLEHIEGILSSVDRGRAADDVAERARMEERAHLLRADEDAQAREAAAEQAEAAPPRRATAKKGSRRRASAEEKA